MIDKIIESIENKGFTEEELAEIGARVLNLTTMQLSAWEVFKDKLDDNVKEELISRFHHLTEE
jgi:hypothetical protein